MKHYPMTPLLSFISLIMLVGLACNVVTINPTQAPAQPPANPGGGVTQPPIQPPGQPIQPNLPPAPAGMVPVPAGYFQMGCVTASSFDCSEARFDHEKPLHGVYLDGYYIDIYEVTNSHYAQCVAAGVCDPPASYIWEGVTIYKDSGYNNPQFGNYPVVWIPWDDANNYCSWAGKNLPTEAQWEKAARGSSDMRIWPWGDTPINCSLANYYPGGSQRFCRTPDVRGNIFSSAVGSYPQGASPYGVMDMAGNVYEFVMDYKTIRYDEYEPDAWPANPVNAVGVDKGLRGGSWETGDFLTRVSYRSAGGGTDGRGQAIGFRCASSPGPTSAAQPPSPGGSAPTPNAAATQSGTSGSTTQPQPPTQASQNQAGPGFSNLTDNFMDPNSGWPVDSSGGSQWYYSGDHYYISVSNANTSAVASVDYTLADGYVMASGTITHNQPQAYYGYYGVVCRLQDASNYYFFEVGLDGYYRIGKVWNGQWSMIGMGEPKFSNAINRGGYNLVTAHCNSNDLSLYVNDIFVETVYDNTFSSGKVGLTASNGDFPGMTAAFDYIIAEE